MINHIAKTTLILPPDMFPPDLQPLVYFTILPTIIGLLIFGYLIIYLYAPKTAKMYFFNKLKKFPIIDVETDEGLRIQEPIKTYTEGVCVGKVSGTTYLLPRPISNENILYKMEPELKKLEAELQKEGKKSEEIKEELRQRFAEEIEAVRKMEVRVLRPSMDKDLGVPVIRAYSSKVNATTLVHMLGLEQNADPKTNNVLYAVPMVTRGGKKHRVESVELNLGKDKNTGEWVMPVLLPVDPKVLKKHLDSMWTPSQLADSNLISEKIGREKEEGIYKKYLMLFIIFGALLALFFVAVLIGTG